MLPPVFTISICGRALHRLSNLASRALDTLSSRLSSLTHPFSHGGILITSLILTLVSIDLVLAILLDEGREVLDSPGAAVGEGLGLCASGEELDGWEALDLVGDVVGRGVDFGDCYLR